MLITFTTDEDNNFGTLESDVLPHMGDKIGACNMNEPRATYRWKSYKVERIEWRLVEYPKSTKLSAFVVCVAEVKENDNA